MSEMVKDNASLLSWWLELSFLQSKLVMEQRQESRNIGFLPSPFLSCSYAVTNTTSHMMTLEAEGWVVYGSTHCRMIASRCCLPPHGFQFLTWGHFFSPNAFSHCDTCTMSSSRTEDSGGLTIIKTSPSWSQARKFLLSLLHFC